MEYLVDLETLKHYSFVEGDVNDEKLLVTLKRVQDTYIEPILGTPLYKKLLSDIENDTLIGAYVTLMTYVLDCVYIACDMKAVTHQNFKIRNKYTGTVSDQNGRSNSVEENNRLQDSLDADFAFYKNRLIGFIKDNESDYPEYCEVGGDKHEEIRPEDKGTNYNDKISFI